VPGNIRLWAAVLLCGPLLLGTGRSRAASFDCAQAVSAVERLICSTPELSALDGEVADHYATQLALTHDASAVRESQRRWLRMRNACKDAHCLMRAHQDRAADLACSDGPAMGSAIGVASCATARLRVLDRKLDAASPSGADALTAWRAERHRACLGVGAAAGGTPGWQAASALQCEVDAAQARLAATRRARGR
jgi:uncharacterized protein